MQNHEAAARDSAIVATATTLPVASKAKTPVERGKPRDGARADRRHGAEKTGTRLSTKTMATQRPAKSTRVPRAIKKTLPQRVLDKPSARRASGKPATRDAASPSSKQDAVLVLLRRPDGATLEALMAATGWQAHSVRGFLAGVVRKKMELELLSERVDGVRIYRIPRRRSQARSVA